MTYFPAATALFLLLLLFSPLTLTVASKPPPSAPPPAPGGCSDAVIAISPCLPFISDPPNYLSTRPSSQCCDLFTSSFRTGEAICLCYLILGNRLLGFPVNTARLLSLSSICVFKVVNGSNSTTSLQSICSGANELPALVSTKGPIFSIPHNFDSDDNTSHPSNTTTASSDEQSSSSGVPADDPNASQANNDAEEYPPEMNFFIFYYCYLLFLIIIIYA